MINSRKAFKNKLRWCQNNEDIIKINILAKHRESKNFMKFWKSTKELNYKNNLPESVEGISDPKGIANLFSHHFKVEPLSSSIDAELSSYDATKNKDTKRHISPREVANVVKKMKQNKAPGFDELSVEHIKYAGEHIYPALAQLYSACLNSGYLPSNLMKTMVVPVPKNKNGDASSIQNYRPISLGTITGKILESLIYPEVSLKIKLNDAQFGFRPGLSTGSAVFSLKSTVDYYRSRDTSVYACFLDLSRAFDLVNYNLLWKKLISSGIAGETVDLLRFWYGNQINFVRWGDSTSSNYKLECGVRQGGLTSPDLFNLYINGLIEELSSAKVGCHVGRTWLNNFSYADDMALLSPSVNGLNKLLAICERYASEHGLKYNVKKTQMMVFKAGRGPDRVPPVYLNGASVERVPKFRYLGHLLTENCCDDEDIERERRALAVRCNMLARRFNRCNNDVKLTLFKAYCQCFYTCQLWVNCTRKARSSIRVQYNDAYRILMRLPRFCSASSMFAEARVPDFFAIIRARIAAFWSHIRQSPNSILQTLSEYYGNYMYKFWLSVHRNANRK